MRVHISAQNASGYLSSQNRFQTSDACLIKAISWHANVVSPSSHSGAEMKRTSGDLTQLQGPSIRSAPKTGELSS